MTKDCKFCDKEGLMILPLRYSAAVADKLSDLSSLPDLPGTLGDGVKDLALTHAKYTARMLREGYLYVLTDRLGIKSWTAYYITEDSFLYVFPAEFPPSVNPTFSCDPTACGINASMIAIPKANDVKKAYLLFTHSPLTVAKLAEYKSKADEYAVQNKMQKFNPAAWLKGDTAQPHSMTAEVAAKTVAEYVLYNQNDKASSRALGLAMQAQLFPPDSSAYAGIDTKGVGEAPGRLGALMGAMKRQKAAAFAIHDHIGVTQELNDFRNDAYKPIDDFMGRIDGNGLSNTRKFDVYHAIDEWRNLIEKGLVADGDNSVESADIRRRALREPIFSDDTKEMRTLKYQTNGIVPTSGSYLKAPTRAQWEATNPKLVEEFEAERERDEEIYLEFAQNKAKKDWQKRYAPQLNIDEMDKFISKMNELSKNAQTDANKRAAQHIVWLKSPRLLHAFDTCDQKDAVSGEALSAQVFQCIFGMEGSTEAEGILTEWATATHIKKENLLLRAFTRDQHGVKKEADKTLAEVTALMAGTTEYSVMPATSWHKAIKGLVSAVKSTDSALDEWMRNQGQSKNYLNPKHIANMEARSFYFISTLTRAVARKGMGGKVETAFVARANALMSSFLGDLALQIEYDTLNAKIDPSKWDDLKQKHARAEAQAKAAADRKSAQQKRAYRQAQKTKAALQNAAIDLLADAQLKAKLQIGSVAKSLGWNELHTQLEESAKQHQNYIGAAKALEKNVQPQAKIPSTPSPTNNYHQVRIGGALAGIESIALLSKFTGLKELGMNMATAEILASASSLGSILIDMMYAHTKSVRELPNYAAYEGIKKGGDIVRGGFKILAGGLAAFAGVITAISDWNAQDKEKDPIQKAILIARFWSGVGSAGAGLLAAFSYSGPLLGYLAEKKGRTAVLSRALNFGSKLAFGLSKRVLLLRVVAWLGWVGVVVTVVDYSGSRI